MSVKINSKLAWNGVDASSQFDIANNKGLISSAILVQNAGVKNAPKDTGALKASITRSNPSNNNISVGTPLEYAPYLEFGTRFQRAQPYLRPALLLNVNKIKAIFARIYKAVKYVK